ncbi:MAG: ribosomal protein S18-alanine N-acetyltransferase [Candidatus Izemoplasmatales bacterium]|nr:ribosomal protein S18-alanine N-acetyltransferase [Candidatus Izemoplasmatales bacterium]
MKLKIRKIEQSDIQFVYDCENKYFHNFTTVEKIENDLIDPLITYYILESKEKIGYINLWIDEEKAQINSLVIVEEFRNKGFGFSFLKMIFNILAEMNVSEITLEVRPSNFAALSLYEKVGFKQVALRRQYYNNGEDAYLMYKRLGRD